MKVLLINTNREKLPQPVLPMGMCCVASALAAQRIDTATLDLCFARNAERSLKTTIASHQPDCIGLSIRNLDNSDYHSPTFFLPEVRNIVQSIRQLTAAPLIIGGSAVSVAPWESLDYLECQIAVAGDGEQTMVDVVSALRDGRENNTLRRLPGVDYREDGKIVLRSTKSGHQICQPPPRPQCWLDLSPYRRHNTPMPIQSKRGCAFHCSYCTYANIEGSNYRLKPAEQVAEEMTETVDATGLRFFEFVDSTFNHPDHHALAVCEALIKRGQRLTLQGSLNPASCSNDLLPMMKRAGFSNLVCTPDSASDEVLRHLGKDFTTSDLDRVVDLVHAVDLPVLWCFLFGGPGETEHTARETLDFIEQRLTGQDVVFLSAGIRIYPGTQLADMARLEGIVGAENSLLEPTFYFSQALAPQRLAELINQHLARNPRCMLASDLRLSFLPHLQRVAPLLRLRTPLWQYAPLLNRVLPRRWLPKGNSPLDAPVSSKMEGG